MNIPETLAVLLPGAKWVLIGDVYEGLEWLDAGIAKPGIASLESAWLEVLANRVIEEENLADSKESAYAKLTEWGLTPDEIAAIITP
jgi:hypothetical protein